MTIASKRYPRLLTILFCISLFFLSLHVIDDVITTDEATESGVTVPEFLFYVGLIYLIVPPLGVILARRGRPLGFVIVTLYGLQAMYGAGLNHVRHMLGDFSGSKLIPAMLAFFGIHLNDIRGYGFASVLMGMLGLGETPPHTHTILSTLIVVINIPLNAALILISFLAFWQIWIAQKQTSGVSKS